MTDWLAFYSRFFTSTNEARSFVDACEAQRPPQQRREAHHAPGPKARLARRGRSENPAEAGVAADFFLAVCAEAVAKLHAGPSVSLRSRQAVREFFCRLVPEPHRELLGEGFRTYRHYPLGTSAVADVLYEVRCSVAHEGSYWDFALHDGDTAMLSNDSEVIANLSPEELIEIVALGCINAAKERL